MHRPSVGHRKGSNASHFSAEKRVKKFSMVIMKRVQMNFSIPKFGFVKFLEVLKKALTSKRYLG
jgi:hypothetical protein